MPTFGFFRVWRALAAMEDRAALRRSRQALLCLDDRLLRDIGITRAEALREARRSEVIED